MSAGTLFVVATPIGNLEDITLRALRVLKDVDIIAAEDTRRTAKLLAHHAISTSTVSFHEHNSRSRVPQLVRRLEAGQQVALVTDAGTPGVSDPGAELVKACVDAGIRVDPIPGASAPLTAAIASGFPLEPLTILGFPPAKAKARMAWFVAASSLEGTFCFFEAPHRITRTLAEAVQYFGIRPIVVGRELTKVHQEFLRGTTQQVAEQLIAPRGELTIVVGPAENASQPAAPPVSDEQLADEFGQDTETAGVRRREVVARLARRYGRPVREVYAAIERGKK